MAAVATVFETFSDVGSTAREDRGGARPKPVPVVAKYPKAQPSGIAEGQPIRSVQTLEQELRRDFSPVILPPPPSALGYSFDVRQQWEGVVTKVEDNEFTVVLRDIRNPTAPEYEAVLPVEEVPPDDLSLLVPGGVLYWTIGYEQTRTGQRKRVSTIRLRRLPAWSRRDLARVEQRARALDEMFRGD